MGTKLHTIGEVYKLKKEEVIRFRHPITPLRYADRRFVNAMKVYIQRNNVQKKLTLYSRLLLRSDGFKAISPRNAYQDITNKNQLDHCHF